MTTTERKEKLKALGIELKETNNLYKDIYKDGKKRGYCGVNDIGYFAIIDANSVVIDMEQHYRKNMILGIISYFTSK